MSNSPLSPAALALGLDKAMSQQADALELERRKKKLRDQGLYSTASGQLLGGMGATGVGY